MCRRRNYHYSTSNGSSPGNGGRCLFDTIGGCDEEDGLNSQREIQGGADGDRRVSCDGLPVARPALIDWTSFRTGG